MQRSLTDYIFITLKGIAMGAADVVPGVSGGTIAFISGIYEELINSVNKINIKALKILKTQGVLPFWKYINGNFLLSLIIGIGISIFSLAKAIKWLLENKPILLWSFFFGLVIASIFMVAKEVTKWRLNTILIFLAGALVAYYISIIPPMQNTESTVFIFFSGALAICAMILPGISGAFILVLLGAYSTILHAIDQKNIKIIALFALGAIFGLLSFARILKWMFSNYKNLTLALLTGFIFGSLNKIWPWKKTLSWYKNSHGVDVPLLQESISPFNFNGNPQLLWAIILALVGFLTIFLLEKIAAKKS
ncbi:DUF368 domain-containing protein [Abyssalbus ytuae]|uniref:DUF368 domain-containing protein n=1 Tax=Abyssalbus ytuae TaxID=2926907 RepID=A0A9E6ZSS1_9FLAO|nr:DUF368 domain-containing protein [Abyssalbus ytuae]UOB18183.1 DUF368 domain-containing protein [Abyssalbus ytuae]